VGRCARRARIGQWHRGACGLTVAATATLDFTVIRQGQRVARFSLRKRERESRDAGQALAAARKEVAQALARQERAQAAVLQARQDYWDAVDVCVASAPVAGAARPGGNELMARVGYCESTAVVVTQRQHDLQRATAACQQAQAAADQRAAEFARTQRREEQAREQLSTWRSREHLAVEMHGDLAMEDEPPRRAVTPVVGRVERLPSSGYE
jgi:phage-related minor tail protein